MIKKAKNRLSLLFTFVTGIILTISLLLASYFLEQQKSGNQIEQFQTILYSLVGMIERETSVNYMDLYKLEEKNNLIIYIEDNGKPISYEKIYKKTTDQKRLITQIEELGEKDGIYLNSRPISVKRIKSKIYKIEGTHGDNYLGQIFIMSGKQGYRSVLTIQHLKENKIKKMEQFVFFIVLGITGITALYFTSRWLVSKALKPVEMNRKKQVEFIAAASHELRSPLAVIGANIAAIRADEGQIDYFFNGIQRECSRMSRLIDDMLLLASVDAKNWSVNKEFFEIDTLLIEIYDTFYAFCKENNMKLKIKLPEEIIPKIRGDRERLKQVLAILLDNAVAYGNKRERKKSNAIELDCMCMKNKVILSVIDHGNGIKKEMKKEIFERFYRVDQSRKDKEHFGLGLSIAKELVELQEGTIYVKDTKGGGCTFCIELPIWNDKN